jgi:hypothetical protein
VADETKRVCGCAQCRMRRAIGPVLLIAVGVIFLIGEYSQYGFRYLWPLLLIVPGTMQVAQALASKEGHTGR